MPFVVMFMKLDRGSRSAYRRVAFSAWLF